MFKKRPLCAFIAVIIIIVFSLYLTNAIKTVPCDKDMTSIFISNFIHTNFTHLLSNLYGLYSLSRVEIKYGSKKFFLLIIFLLIITSIFEIIVHKIINLPCSIGFSGILYGVLTFEMIMTKNYFDYYLFGAIISDIITSKVFKNNISVSGHIIGAISGIIGGLTLSKIKFFN